MSFKIQIHLSVQNLIEKYTFKSSVSVYIQALSVELQVSVNPCSMVVFVLNTLELKLQYSYSYGKSFSSFLLSSSD